MRKIRMGMVGGGPGAFIGAIHRIAAAMDGQIELVCGAFSSDPEASLAAGRALYLDENRCYPSYQQLFAAEAALPPSQRMDFVSIVTPNHLHFPVAKMAFAHGFHVMSDKPATMTLAEALQLEAALGECDCLYGLTHTYTGYPMVKEARHRIARGELGSLRKVLVEYPQGWLADADAAGGKQAAWRLDPTRAGISCCMGDIGVHAANLAEYVCGIEIREVCADLQAAVPGRLLDDDGTVLLKFEGNVRGVLLASQIAVGEENNLKLRVYGDKAGLEWSQQEPNTLWLKYPDRPVQMLRAGVGELCEAATGNMRTPAGHPEGYLEAFANLYREFAAQIRRHLYGQSLGESPADLPGIREAVRGMAFIEQVVAASRSASKWRPLSLSPVPIPEVQPEVQPEARQ